MKEKDIQKSILEYLKLKRILAWKNHNVGIYKKASGSYIPTGMKGLSDIFAVHKGRFYAIEVKRHPNKATEHQLEFGRMVEEAGGVFILAFSLEDVMETFEHGN